MAQKRDKRKQSLTQVYVSDWALPFCLFLSTSVLMFCVGGWLADPVLQGGEVLALMLLPVLSSGGIAIAAVTNLSRKQLKSGILNAITFLFSLMCLPAMFFGLALIGMSY
ncbi:MAG: hypothetical protein AAFY72_17740 [Cyanobacteria bacterium J06649_4]